MGKLRAKIQVDSALKRLNNWWASERGEFCQLRLDFEWIIWICKWGMIDFRCCHVSKKSHTSEVLWILCHQSHFFLLWIYFLRQIFNHIDKMEFSPLTDLLFGSICFFLHLLVFMPTLLGEEFQSVHHLIMAFWLVSINLHLTSVLRYPGWFCCFALRKVHTYWCVFAFISGYHLARWALCSFFLGNQGNFVKLLHLQ